MSYYEIFPSKPSRTLHSILDVSKAQFLHMFLNDSVMYETLLLKDDLKVTWLQLPRRKKFYYDLSYSINGAFQRTGKCQKIPWVKLDSKFRRKAKEGAQNADKKWCWRSNNVFLVKYPFTFGLRVPPPGHVDIIQTTVAPLLIFIPKRNLPFYQKHAPERLFQYTDEYSFNAFILLPNDRYLAHAKQPYILMSVQKTLFSLNRMEAKTLNDLKSKDSHLLFKKIDYYKYSPTLLLPPQTQSKAAAAEMEIQLTKWDLEENSEADDEREEEQQEPSTRWTENCGDADSPPHIMESHAGQSFPNNNNNNNNCGVAGDSSGQAFPNNNNHCGVAGDSSGPSWTATTTHCPFKVAGDSSGQAFPNNNCGVAGDSSGPSWTTTTHCGSSWNSSTNETIPSWTMTTHCGGSSESPSMVWSQPSASVSWTPTTHSTTTDHSELEVPPMDFNTIDYSHFPNTMWSNPSVNQQEESIDSTILDNYMNNFFHNVEPYLL